jgi:hypothetical protein
MPQDEWQDTLTDAAKPDEENSPWEIDMYRVIAHDAPDVQTPAARHATPAKGGRVSIAFPRRHRSGRS